MVAENRGTMGGGNEGGRAEIDTSAPFESVKEAVSRFGGIGFWKPYSHHKSSESENNTEEIDIEKLGEQTARLENDLLVKERKTLDVLRELESTKLLIDELKSKLQKEAASDEINEEAAEDKENHFATPNTTTTTTVGAAAAPRLILMELKQAKLHLSKTTADLTDIRASVESFSKKLEKERLSVEKTRERLTHNSSKMSLLEGELSQTRLKLQLVKDMEINSRSGSDGTSYDFRRELHRLSSEIDQFKEVGQAAELEVQRALTEIEQRKTQITTAETRLVAAKKMKEAVRATEAMALEEEINKAISSNHHHSAAAVTLTYEEYYSLISKAREAEEESDRRVVDAMVQVDEATMSKVEILKKVEEATEEGKTSKKLLEEALDRVEAANRGKLAVEEALRRWRSDHAIRKRRALSSSSSISTKFKNSSSSQFRKHLVDDDDDDDDDDGATMPTATPDLKKQTTLSIGQILSQKLLLAEEFGSGKLVVKETSKRKKVSLGQMLSNYKQNNDGDLAFAAAGHNHHKRKGGNYNNHPTQFSSPSKNKKLGLARGFSLLLAKKSKKNKKPFC